MSAYEFAKIEPKWQYYWEKRHVFRAGIDRAKPKYYALDMFPYPSSQGLHVGHPEGYTATDIVSRYKRARGFNVLHPMGWDAFGLPAEQYAIQTGVHPAVTTKKAIETFRRQLKSLGFSYDWEREIATCDPSYYRWTQWLFLKLYERGLAYQTEVPVNWCPALKTVLANEEVVDGKSERGGHPVHRVPMKQWMLKITAYAERLLQDLDGLDWPESTKELQRNWIGKSEGLEFRFEVTDGDSMAVAAPTAIEVYTTRPDTVFGATFLVLAPEHPLVKKIATPDHRADVDAYVDEASRKSEIDRQDTEKAKTGVFTGALAINPANGDRIPIWIADYVMMGYGTGAIMAVPGHDERDHAFARQYALPIQEVVRGVPAAGGASETSAIEGQVFVGEGVAVNSGFLDGMKTAEAKKAAIDWAERKGIGKGAIKYKLRDWLFSRQRYWGEPFPIVHLDRSGRQPLPVDELPVVLPDVVSYEPSGTGESPLAGIADWVRYVSASQGGAAGEPGRRETDTMPGSAASSWYFLRYIDPKNEDAPWSREAEQYWMPVDLYLGGAEHAVGHLLYARFWTKVLHDAGLIGVSEPFRKLVHQGMILGPDGEKMSKSRGNVINPDDVVKEYGADTLRLYEMFMGPLEKEKPWSTAAIEGVYRFLSRTWRVYFQESGTLQVTEDAPTEADLRVLHKTIRKVTEDIEELRFNTAISQMMVFINHFTKEARAPRACLVPFAQLLNPFAPHIAEEIWERLHPLTDPVADPKPELTFHPWPAWDEALAKDSHLTIAVQVMGKTRGTIEVEPGAAQAVAEAKARENPAVEKALQGKAVKKVIFVKDKILNFVVGDA